jgi:hypothetical protein
MQKTFYLAVLFAMGFFAVESPAQSTVPQTDLKATSLCILQKQVAEGQHEPVRVSGVYGPGLDHSVLEDPSCPTEGTWIELDLKSEHNKQKLRGLLNQSQRAYVVVEGEFYGSPVLDPKLSEAIRKSYHPGWGHLAAFKTKLVVHEIRDVKPVPTDHTNGASLNHGPENDEGMITSVGPRNGRTGGRDLKS